MTWIYAVPISPVPYNNAYITARFGGHRYLSPQAAEFKADIKTAFQDWDNLRGKPQLPHFANLAIDCLFPPRALYYKNGNLRRKDASSFIKLIEDALAEHLQIDDMYNVQVSVSKRELTDDLGTPVVVVSLDPAPTLSLDLDLWYASIRTHL